MKKKIAALLLTVVTLISVLSVGAICVSANPERKTSTEAIAILKAEEGFSKTPYWDYAQWTVGYGTKCPDDKLEYYKQNGITQIEAEQLLKEYIAKFEAELDRFITVTGTALNQNQYDALILFSYNCGTAWAYSPGVFYNAIVSGAKGNELINAFSRWCNAGGQVKTFLLRRRLCEANMYLNGVYSQTPPENFGYILYDPCDGTVSPNVQGYDTSITAQMIPTPKYEGYQFDGWYTQKVGGKKVTILDSSVKNSRLYAHWIDAAGKNPAEEEGNDITVTVIANHVNIRKGPGVHYQTLGTANIREQLVITETATGDGYTWGKFSKGWICLKYTDYDDAVAPEPEVPPKPQTKKGTVKVNDVLRVRSGPSTGYPVVARLRNGTKVEILEQKTAGSMVWGKISNGWISMDYVILESGEQDVPPVTRPPETTPPVTVPPATQPTEPESQKETLTGKVKVGDRLRVRKGPSTATKVVGYLYPNEKVTITEQQISDSMTWGKTAKGWVSMDYITLDKTNNSDSAEEKITGVVKVEDILRIRKGAGTSYTITGYLPTNSKVEIIRRKTVGETVWGQISKGWISLDYVVLDKQNVGTNTSNPQPVKKTVTADCLRIRSAAGTSNVIVGYLYKGTKVEILETKMIGTTTWGRVAKGWISMEYIK